MKVGRYWFMCSSRTVEIRQVDTNPSETANYSQISSDPPAQQISVGRTQISPIKDFPTCLCSFWSPSMISISLEGLITLFSKPRIPWPFSIWSLSYSSHTRFGSTKVQNSTGQEEHHNQRLVAWLLRKFIDKFWIKALTPTRQEQLLLRSITAWGAWLQGKVTKAPTQQELLLQPLPQYTLLPAKSIRWSNLKGWTYDNNRNKFTRIFPGQLKCSYWSSQKLHISVSDEHYHYLRNHHSTGISSQHSVPLGYWWYGTYWQWLFLWRTRGASLQGPRHTPANGGYLDPCWNVTLPSGKMWQTDRHWPSSKL